MISLIIIYSIGVFFAYIILGYFNDRGDVLPHYSLGDTLLSWLVPISVLAYMIFTHQPSFKKFINIFNQQKTIL